MDNLEQSLLSARVSTLQAQILELEQIRNLRLALEQQLTQAISTEELETELKEVIEHQKEIQQHLKEQNDWYKRNNPIVPYDEPIYDYNEVTLTPGQRVTFTLPVPEDHIFFWRYFNITFNFNTFYDMFADGRYEPTLTDVVQDFGDHEPFFIPPRKLYATAVVRATNLGAGNQTYSVFFGGWLRQIKEPKDVTEYENL